jgi:hypothetical protein
MYNARSACGWNRTAAGPLQCGAIHTSRDTREMYRLQAGRLGRPRNGPVTSSCAIRRPSPSRHPTCPPRAFKSGRGGSPISIRSSTGVPFLGASAMSSQPDGPAMGQPHRPRPCRPIASPCRWHDAPPHARPCARCRGRRTSCPAARAAQPETGSPAPIARLLRQPCSSTDGLLTRARRLGIGLLLGIAHLRVRLVADRRLCHLAVPGNGTSMIPCRAWPRSLRTHGYRPGQLLKDDVALCGDVSARGPASRQGSSCGGRQARGDRPKPHRCRAFRYGELGAGASLLGWVAQGLTARGKPASVVPAGYDPNKLSSLY